MKRRNPMWTTGGSVGAAAALGLALVAPSAMAQAQDDSSAAEHSDAEHSGEVDAERESRDSDQRVNVHETGTIPEADPSSPAWRAP